MFEELEKREAAGRPIRVAVVGAGGSMGMGVAWQLGRTPGMRMVAAIDADVGRVQHAASLHGTEWGLAASSDAAERTLRRGRTVVCLIDPAPDNPARMKRRVRRDALVTWDDIELPARPLIDAYRRQARLLAA